MSDIRGISPGGKTATAVVLVVLLQVIVVALLGLAAIGGDREEGARLAREEAEGQAYAQARAVLEQAREGFMGALQEAARIARNPGGLRNLPRDLWYRAFRDLYRVDGEGRVRSAGGTLLHVPPEVAAAEEQAADRVPRERAERALDALPGSDAAAVEARRRFVEAYPFATDGRGYAKSVGEALRLAIDAAAPPDASPDAVAAAVLRAWETAAMNEGRPEAAQPGFAFVRAQLARIAAAPGREALAAALGGLDAAREGLEEVRALAVPLARELALRPGPARIVPLLRRDEVVGLAALPLDEAGQRPEALLARLDRREMALAVEAPAATAGAGAVRVVQRGASVEAGPSVRVSLERPDFETGLDLVAPRPVPRESGGPSGPREGFYWTILALAALGVGTAGAVLVRILRREVRLARLKADFVSNLSHELKTPLTSIGMFSEMLRDPRIDDAGREEAAAVIAQESDRLQRIVGGMIEVARREAGAMPYALVAADLNAPVFAACERFRRLERDAGLDLAWDLASGLPAVRLDAGAVDDAVTNLLSNAWKYRRGDRAMVRVRTRRAGRKVELTVADDGIGIPRRERRRVFAMFYRAENYLSRGVPGTGLGLALVRTVVSAHGARIRVEAAPGGGTVFRIRFPAAGPAGRPDASGRG